MRSEALRITQDTSDFGSWEIASRAPDGRLRPHVIGYLGLKSAMHVTRERHLPSGEAALVLNLGRPHDVVHGPDRAETMRFRGTALMGVYDRPFFTESAGSKHVVVVRLTPPGAHLLFGVPMCDLHNRWVELDLVDRRFAHRIAPALDGCAGWEAIFRVLDWHLIGQMHGAGRSSPAADWAWARLHDTGGGATIESVTDGLGVSHKRLVGLFRQHVGLLPKVTSTLTRFNRVLRKMRGRSRVDWAAVAQDCGYYDQAHLIREMKTFANGTPLEIRRLVAGFTLNDPA